MTRQFALMGKRGTAIHARENGPAAARLITPTHMGVRRRRFLQPNKNPSTSFSHLSLHCHLKSFFVFLFVCLFVNLQRTFFSFNQFFLFEVMFIMLLKFLSFGLNFFLLFLFHILFLNLKLLFTTGTNTKKNKIRKQNVMLKKTNNNKRV